MKAKDFVLAKYPKAYPFGMIDNARRQTSTVIIKGNHGLEIFPNEGATTDSPYHSKLSIYIKDYAKQVGTLVIKKIK